jgi:hypothetical protein
MSHESGTTRQTIPHEIELLSHEKCLSTKVIMNLD